MDIRKGRGSTPLYNIRGDDICEGRGSTPAFNFTDNWGGSSNTSTAYAVEKQDNGSYKLAVKQVETWMNPSGISETRTSWNIHYISSDGTFNWEESAWLDSIVDAESDFGQDLNGDEAVGFNIYSLSNVTTDSLDDDNNLSTTFLKKSSEGKKI